MNKTLKIKRLTAEAFSPFGEILEVNGPPDKIINQGMCGRHHDVAKLDFVDGNAGISLFNAQKREFPIKLDLVERHPEGSQAFVPMTEHPFLVIVAKDENGAPGIPEVFITKPRQGVNYHRNIWHGVLTPIFEPGLFAVIDRIGEGPNLQEHWFETPYEIVEE